MRALVISHDPSEEPALVGDELERQGFRLDVFTVCDEVDDPVSHRAFPSLDGVDLVVAMGAPWSVYDTASIGSWINRELDLVRDAHRRGLPFLGICFGAQLLSAALGGTVERAPRPELGWVDVRSAVPDLIAAGPWFQWHGDRFTVPSGAIELARNDVGVQAMRMGRSLGVQFHPELDLALAQSWLRGDQLPDQLFATLDVDPRVLLAECAVRCVETEPNTRRLVAGFLHALDEEEVA